VPTSSRRLRVWQPPPRSAPPLHVKSSRRRERCPDYEIDLTPLASGRGVINYCTRRHPHGVYNAVCQPSYGGFGVFSKEFRVVSHALNRENWFQLVGEVLGKRHKVFSESHTWFLTGPTWIGPTLITLTRSYSGVGGGCPKASGPDVVGQQSSEQLRTTTLIRFCLFRPSRPGPLQSKPSAAAGAGHAERHEESTAGAPARRGTGGRPRQGPYFARGLDVERAPTPTSTPAARREQGAWVLFGLGALGFVRWFAVED
jgi:hypothetical protein